MPSAANDAAWMAAAARLSARARPLAHPNPGVAALLVKQGLVIARGWTQEGGRPHAEAMALADVSDGGAAGATLYVTLEPCAHQSERGPACTDLVIAAKPERFGLIRIADIAPRSTSESWIPAFSQPLCSIPVARLRHYDEHFVKQCCRIGRPGRMALLGHHKCSRAKRPKSSICTSKKPQTT